MTTEKIMRNNQNALIVIMLRFHLNLNRVAAVGINLTFHLSFGEIKVDRQGGKKTSERHTWQDGWIYMIIARRVNAYLTCFRHLALAPILTQSSYSITETEI